MKFKINTPMATLAAFAATTTAIVTTVTSASALSVTQENNTTTLLNTLSGGTSGLSNFTVTPTGLNPAFGKFTNDNVFGLGSGVVLSTGNAVDVVGPNDTGSKSGLGTIAQLDISFDADSTVNKLFFQYVFGSEEFLEFAGSQIQ